MRLGVSPTMATALVHSQFPIQPALPEWPAALPWVLTSLIVLVDFFFNYLLVRVPSSLIFWCFWLFIDFRLVVILLLVVRGSKGFLPTSPSWPELPHILYVTF